MDNILNSSLYDFVIMLLVLQFCYWLFSTGAEIIRDGISLMLEGICSLFMIIIMTFFEVLRSPFVFIFKWIKLHNLKRSNNVKMLHVVKETTSDAILKKMIIDVLDNEPTYKKINELEKEILRRFNIDSKDVKRRRSLVKLFAGNSHVNPL